MVVTTVNVSWVADMNANPSFRSASGKTSTELVRIQAYLEINEIKQTEHAEKVQLTKTNGFLPGGDRAIDRMSKKIAHKRRKVSKVLSSHAR